MNADGNTGGGTEPRRGPGQAPTSPPGPMTPASDTLRAVVEGHLPYRGPKSGH